MSETLDLPKIDADMLAKQSGVPLDIKQPLNSALVPATDLTKIDLTDVALAMYGKWSEEVAAVKSNLSTLVLDLSTPTKITEARSLRKRLILDPLAAARKVSAGIKSKMAQTSKAVGAELERIEAGYNEADKLILPKIEAAEAEQAREREEKQRIERERIERHQANIARIRAYAEKAEQPDMTADRIAAGMAQLQAIPTPTKETWEEFAVPAADAICWALERMRITHARVLRAEQAEAEAAELRARLEAQSRMDAPPAGPAGDGSQKPDDAAAIPGAKAGSDVTLREDAPRSEAPPESAQDGGKELSGVHAERRTPQAADAAPAGGSPELRAALDSIEKAELAPLVRSPGPITMVEPAYPPRSFRRAAAVSEPTPLEDSTPAELRNEWMLFEHALEHVMPMVERRCAAVDVTRFNRALERMRAIFLAQGEVKA